MPAVARGIDENIAPRVGGASLEDVLERDELIIARVKAQIIDEEDEVQRIAGQRLQNVRDLL